MDALEDAALAPLDVVVGSVGGGVLRRLRA